MVQRWATAKPLIASFLPGSPYFMSSAAISGQVPARRCGGDGGWPHQPLAALLSVSNSDDRHLEACIIKDKRSLGHRCDGPKSRVYGVLDTVRSGLAWGVARNHGRHDARPRRNLGCKTRGAGKAARLVCSPGTLLPTIQGDEMMWCCTNNNGTPNNNKQQGSKWEGRSV